MGVMHEDSACNGLEHGILTLAKYIRKALLILQDISVVRGHAATLTNTQRNAAWRKKGQAFVLIDHGTIFVNSTYKFNCLSPHLGYKARTLHYYCHPPGARFVKVLPPNLRVLPDRTFQMCQDIRSVR